MTASEDEEGGALEAGGGPEVQRVFNALRDRLLDETYRVGDTLPPQRELVREFGVSRDTVARAVKRMAELKWVLSKQGSGTRVLRKPKVSPHGKPLLSHFLEKAFEQPEVSVDVAALTAESFVSHFFMQVLRVEGDVVAPRTVRVRMMLPAQDTDLLFPRATDPEEDDWVRQRWRNMARDNLEKMRGYCARLKAKGANVDFQVRRVRWTPQSKVYVINETDLLTSDYIPVRQRVPVEEGRQVEAVDVMGVGADLSHHRKALTPEEKDSHDGSFHALRQEWFEATWQYLATEEG